MSSRSRWRSRSRSADLTLVSDRAVSQIGDGRSMLVNLVPEFLAVLAAPDPAAAYSEYLDRHGPVLTSYWQNYVLDPASPHAEQVNAGALVVGGRGIAFVCLEHFTGRANPQTYGMGLAPHLLSLWVAHEVAHAVQIGRASC